MTAAVFLGLAGIAVALYCGMLEIAHAIRYRNVEVHVKLPRIVVTTDETPGDK
jgi:hypothetical protein